MNRKLLVFFLLLVTAAWLVAEIIVPPQGGGGTAAGGQATNAIANSSGKGTNTTLYGTIQLGDAGESATTTSSNTFRFRGTAHAHDSVFLQALIGDRVLYIGPGKDISASAGVSSAELEFLDGVASSIQGQLDARIATASGIGTNNSLYRLTLRDWLLIPWSSHVAASTVLQASNGLRQIVNVGSNTNFTFSALAGSDASNSVPINYLFTQDAIGKYIATLNGASLNIDSLPNSTTEVSIWIEKGVTNFTTIIPVGRYPVAELAGFGTSSTNFAPQANGPRVLYINGGKTNVHMVGVDLGQQYAEDEIGIRVTNRTADVCTMTAGGTTTKWIPIGGSLVFPISVTNGLFGSVRIIKTNAYYGFQYMANPLP